MSLLRSKSDLAILCVSQFFMSFVISSGCTGHLCHFSWQKSASNQVKSQEDWTRIPVPTLILANEYDPLHPFGYGEVLAHSIPGAILEKVTPKAVDAHQHARDIQRAIERFFGRAL